MWLKISTTCMLQGQTENTEVWKPKYRNEKYGNGSTEVRRKAAYRCLVRY